MLVKAATDSAFEEFQVGNDIKKASSTHSFGRGQSKGGWLKYWKEFQ